MTGSVTPEPEAARAALEVIRSIGGDALVRSLLKTFVGYAGTQMSLAAAAAETGDVAAIARLAHAVKSSARQLGADALADHCEVAERAALAGDGPVAAAAVADMEREFVAVTAWMNAMSMR